LPDADGDRIARRLVLALDGHERAHGLERLAQRCRVDARVVVLVPVVEHGGRDVEADPVVHHGAAADAHALQDLDAEVARQLERAVGVEPRVHLGRVLRELRPVDVRAAFDDQDVASALGQGVGGDRPSRSAPDDHDVGDEPVCVAGSERAEGLVRRRRPGPPGRLLNRT
jgi:hypothetical protein